MMGMKAKRIILTRQLPKTGQVTSYRAGDDGIYEAGWWKGRLNATNKTRFVAKTIDGDDVVIDRATGLTWAADGNAQGCANGGTKSWNAAIDWPFGIDFAGFGDWRLPNINELFSIMDFSKSPLLIDLTLFPNTKNTEYWSSTTWPSHTGFAEIAYYEEGIIYYSSKTSSHYLRSVRGGL